MHLRSQTGQKGLQELGPPGESGIRGLGHQVPIIHEVVSRGVTRGDAFVWKGPLNNTRNSMEANLGGDMAEWVAKLHIELRWRQPVDVQVEVLLAVQLLAVRFLLVAGEYLRGAASVHDGHH